MSQPESSELGLKPVSKKPVNTTDNPNLLAILDQNIDQIESMAAEYNEIVGEYHKYALIYPYDDETSPKTPEYVHALKKYKEYNEWPLYVAVHKLAIKLIMLLNEGRLSMVKYTHYKKSLLNLIPRPNTKYTHDIMPDELNTLIAKLKSGMIQNENVQMGLQEVQRKLNDENEASSRTWVLMGKGGGNKSRKKIHITHKKSLKHASLKSIKSTNRKAVAAAIKDIPLSKARADFAALKAVPCADINQAAKVGNAVMDHYFFRHRLAAKTKRAVSYYDWINTDWQRNESEHSFYKFNLGQGKTPDKARYAVFRLYYGAIHGFKPLIAKWLYCTYQPRTAVLDFSAGWGGRCLGAMALGIPYIGIDTNKDLRPAYERMVKELDSEPNSKSNPKVTMRFQDAAATDFSRFKYDMVFTSPPYFKTVRPIEGYAHMPHYNDRADFNARFLFPVVRATYSNLARGGTYALNIPDDMYAEIRAAGILPSRLHAKHRLFLQPRFAKGNPNHPDVQYKEHIYVWKKP
jgi:16S rRNA G966 N2-methylase RsmD